MCPQVWSKGTSEYSLPVSVSAPSPYVTVVERRDSSSVLVFAVVIPGFMQIFFFLGQNIMMVVLGGYNTWTTHGKDTG